MNNDKSKPDWKQQAEELIRKHKSISSPKFLERLLSDAATAATERAAKELFDGVLRIGHQCANEFEGDTLVRLGGLIRAKGLKKHEGVDPLDWAEWLIDLGQELLKLEKRIAADWLEQAAKITRLEKYQAICNCGVELSKHSQFQGCNTPSEMQPICPALKSLKISNGVQKEAIDRLVEADRALQQEKNRRVYYQDIVYSVCNSIDKMQGGKVVCGSYAEPSMAVQRVMQVIALAAEGG